MKAVQKPCKYIKKVMETEAMISLKKQFKQRAESGSALSEFAAGMLLFFCFFFVPLVDMSFIPVRYLLVNTYLEKVVHHMALCEKRSEAIKYLNSGDWKAGLEQWGIKIRDARANLLINDNSGSKKLSVSAGNSVPQSWLPNSSKKGEAFVYSLELAVDADIPPLFSSDVGLPGFNKPILFTFKSHEQWENLAADPLKTSAAGKLDYYINQ